MIVSQNICGKQTTKINRFSTAFLWGIPDYGIPELPIIPKTTSSLPRPFTRRRNQPRAKTRLNSNPRLTEVGSSDANVHCQSISLPGKYCFENEPRNAIRLWLREGSSVRGHVLIAELELDGDDRKKNDGERLAHEKTRPPFFFPTLHEHSIVF